MPRSLSFLEKALREGVSVLGSSSLLHEPVRERYPLWTHLPYVTDPDFMPALGKAIAEYDIGSVFTPNPVVWDYLSRRLPDHYPDVKLVNGSPIEGETAPYREALRFAEHVIEQPLAFGGPSAPAPSLSPMEIAALFRHAETIPGMCDHEKMAALCEIFRRCPPGDVVEIGTWWGKSAFILSRLARSYHVGNVLCVDPWSNEHLMQGDQASLVDGIPVDAGEAFTVFQLSLLPYANGNINYLRQPSVDAHAAYVDRNAVANPLFGETIYSGRIAVLHIDGNHSYANAKSDMDLWSGLVAPGGWIVVDDYTWPYGDGPRRVGDEFLRSQPGSDCISFVMGGALFIQRS